MSRCFPFPPPGYEKKISSHEAGSLLKKEKKHKRDKERKEGKERKDKETISKDKHKDRKEKKKEKHRDKKDKEKSSTACVLPNTKDGEQFVTSNGNGESNKFIQDLARRIRDEEAATDSQSVGRKISFPNGVTETNLRKVDENAVLQASARTDQKGGESMVKPSEKKDNHRRESVAKSDLPSDREGVVKKNEPKHTTHRSSSQEEKKQIGNDKPKYVEGGPRLKERDLDFRERGKRKDHETNGFLYENGSRPNKIQRPVSSPLTSLENGRVLEAYQTLPKPVSELQGPVCSDQEVKEHRVNGFIDSQQPQKRPTSSSVKVKENSEAAASAKKRPHPDLKYLDQILNVPQKDEAGENEEQEWLFGQSGVKLLKKPKTDSDETLQVWNQALRIESVDNTVALPYVVPF